MKLSLLFSVVLLVPIAIAVSATSHSGPEMKRCIDASDRVVADSFCALPARAVALRGSLNPVPAYRTYYGGFGNFEPGTRAWGGSDRPLMGHVYQLGPDSLAPASAQADAVHHAYQPYVAGPH